jgi:hypothetical protein
VPRRKGARLRDVARHQRRHRTDLIALDPAVDRSALVALGSAS